MNESSLRLKARIGNLRGLSLFVLICVVVVLIALGPQAIRGISTPAEPRILTIGDMVAGGASADAFVATSGYAVYEVRYEETSDGRTVASYFLLIDETTGEGVVVKASTAQVVDRTSGPLGLTGLVHETPADLRDLIQTDLAEFSSQGIVLDPSFLVTEGERPMGAAAALAILAGSVFLGALSLVPLFFPTTVFAPRPVDTLAVSTAGATQSKGLLATGRFQQLKRLEPTLELGRRKQRFTNAVANLIRLADGRMALYIHHVVRTRLYGVVTISKQQSDWAVLISRTDPWRIDPGKIYGWKDRWAVRFRRQETGGKPETLYVSFDHAADQAEFVKSTREMGFSVGLGADY
jgi:hypothetical protein